MRPEEINIGETYQCRHGWFRQPIKVRPDGMVRYYSWRAGKREDPPSIGSGHINWFSNSAICVEASAQS